MSMTKDQKEAVLASVAQSIVATLENNRRFTQTVNEAVNEAVRDAIDISIEDEITSAVSDAITNMDFDSDIFDEIEFDSNELSVFAVNRELTFTVDNYLFHGGYKPENLEQLVAFMQYACEDVSFLEHAKRISRMVEILDIL